VIGLGKYKQARTYTQEFFDALLSAVMELQGEAVTRVQFPLHKVGNTAGATFGALKEVKYAVVTGTDPGHNEVSANPCPASDGANQDTNTTLSLWLTSPIADHPTGFDPAIVFGDVVAYLPCDVDSTGIIISPDIEAVSTSDSHYLLGAVHLDTSITGAIGNGDLIVRIEGSWTNFAKGGDGSILEIDPATHMPAWLAAGGAGAIFECDANGHPAWLAAGANGDVLTMDPTGVPVWESPVHALLDGDIDGDTDPAAPVQGDLIVGQVVGPDVKWKRLAVGAAYQVLTGTAGGTLSGRRLCTRSCPRCTTATLPGRPPTTRRRVAR